MDPRETDEAIEEALDRVEQHERALREAIDEQPKVVPRRAVAVERAADDVEQLANEATEQADRRD